MKKIAILSITLLFALSAQALEFTVGNLKYSTNVDSTSVTVKNSLVKPVGELVIPSHVAYNGKDYAVKTIGKSAFANCVDLTTITIPNSVTSIGDESFFDCVTLISIVLPQSVTQIGESAFGVCSNLISIILPEGITSIEDRTFLYCNNLISITFPDSLTSIGDSAFYECNNLASVSIPSSVSSIGAYAFCACSSLASVKLPENLTSVKGCAFSGCSNLTSVMLPLNVTSIDGGAFSDCGRLISINIPESVSSIGEVVFANCSSLTSINLPKGITSIRSGTFWGCSGLQEIYIKNTTPPTVGTSGFYQVDKSTCKLYVPIGSKKIYETADGWKEFQNIEEIEMIPDKSEYKYQPFIMDGTCEWQSLEWRMFFEEPTIVRRVISNKDSVYQGKNYKIIYDYVSCSTNEKNKYYVGLIREEDKRVYYVGRTTYNDYYDTEILLYDFNLNVGDEFLYPYLSEKLQISRVDTVLVEGVWRRAYIFGNVEYYPSQIHEYGWLEGLGCLNLYGITDPFSPIPTASSPQLECVVHGDKKLYHEYPEEDCPCSSLSSQPVVKDVGRISFYVRDRQLYIHAPDQAFTTLKIYTSDGKLIKSVSLREQTDEITYSLEGLTPGSYLFIVGSADSQQSGQFVVR